MPTAEYLALREQFADLREVTEQLLERAQQLKLSDVEQRLQTVWFRLHQGPIRVLVLGTTSAGKSTLVNSAVGDFVSPEGDGATSPVPVWIQAGRGKKYSSTYIDMLPWDGIPSHTKIIASNAYLPYFCYAPRTTTDAERQTRFQEYEAVKIRTGTEFFQERQFTLVDTPGLNANDDDTARTLRTVGRGAEMVVFICKTANIHETDTKFLQEIFEDCGDCTQFSEAEPLLKEHDRFTRLSVEKSLFVVHNINVVTGAAGKRVAFEKSALAVFGQAFDEKRHLFHMNLLHARLHSAGPYPYSQVFPDGATAEDRDSYTDKEAEEQKNAEKIPKHMIAKAGSELDALLTALDRRAAELCQKPEAILAPIRKELRACGSLLEEEELDRAKQKPIPVPEKLQRKKEQVEKELKGFPDLESRADSIHHGFAQAADAQWRAAKAALVKILKDANTATERLNLFLREPVKENIQTASEKAVADMLRQSGWDRILVPMILENFGKYMKKTGYGLAGSVISHHAQFCQMLQKTDETYWSYAKSANISYRSRRTIEKSDPMHTVLNECCSWFYKEIPVSMISIALKEPLLMYCAKKRPNLLPGDGVMRGFKNWWTTAGLTYECYSTVFSKYFLDTLYDRVKGYTERIDPYSRYCEIEEMMYGDIVQALKTRKCVLEEEKARIEKEIDRYIKAVARERKESINQEYRRICDKCEQEEQYVGF